MLKELTIRAINKELEKLWKYGFHQGPPVNTQSSTIAAMETASANFGEDINNYMMREDGITATLMHGYIPLVQAGGTVSIISGEAGRPGIIRLNTNTGTTPYAWIRSEITSLSFGSGYELVAEGEFRVNQLSTPTQRFIAVFGFSDPGSLSAGIDTANILYDEGGFMSSVSASPNWQCMNSNTSVRTRTITNVPVVAGEWVRFRIVGKNDGTEIRYYINGNLVANHTANIPTTPARAFGFGWYLYKVLGTGVAVTMDADWFGHGWRNFQTPR